MCLLGYPVSDLTDNGTPMGTTKPPIFLFQKFVFYRPPDAEKFADFNGNTYFRNPTKMAEISSRM